MSLILKQYYFTFFGNGAAALKTLQSLVEDTIAQKIPENQLVASPVGEDSRSRDHSAEATSSRKPYDFQPNSSVDPGTAVLREPVRATLSAYSPIASVSASPRQSGEWSRNSLNIDRKSFDFSRRSVDGGRKGSNMSNKDYRRAFSERRARSASQNRKQSDRKHLTGPTPSPLFRASTESLADSQKASGNSNVKFEASGSQILERSDVFETPTIQRAHGSSNLPINRGRRSSVDSNSASHKPDLAQIRIRPPTRSQTEQTTSSERPQAKRTDSHNSQSNASPSLQQIVKAGGYPLQKAGRFADYLKTRSKRMSNLFASESMGYVEKVSGMLAGGRKHYVDRNPMNREDETQHL